MIMKVYAHKKNGDYIEFSLTGKGKPGGEGTMYEIGKIKGFEGNYCAKIYKDETLERHGAEKYNKLKYMIQHPPKKLQDDSGNILICYPKFVLFDSPYKGKFVGFVMPLAPKGSLDLINLTRTESANFTSPLKNNIPDEEKVFYEYPRPNSPDEVNKLENRYRIVHNIASVFSWLHADGSYVVGDIKRENILMTIGRGVSLVDVDSVQITDINGDVIFRNEVYTPEYCPPEIYQNQTKGIPINKKDVSYDLFSMAVLFYWILVGIHPYNCTLKGNNGNAGVASMITQSCYAYGKKKEQLDLNKNHMVFPFLPKVIRDLFLKAFEGSPEQRPTALEWKNVMKSIISSLPKETCQSGQLTHMHTQQNSQQTNQQNTQQSSQLSQLTPAGAAQSPKPASFKWLKCPRCGTGYYKTYSLFCHICGKQRI